MQNYPKTQQYQIVATQNWLTKKPNQNAVLIILFLIFFVVLACISQWNNFIDLNQIMPASSLSVFTQHQFYRAWTTIFVHGDLKHLVSNLFLFSILGYFLLGYFSMLLFPLGAFFVGGITNLIVLSSMPPKISLIGLSGVVYWMGGAWLVLYFLIENRKTIWQKALRSIGVSLVLFMPSEAFDPSISYVTHFVGFILGILSGALYYFVNKTKIRAEDASILIENEPQEII